MLLDKLAFTENKYEELSVKISDPSIMANQKEWRKLCKEHADLEIIVTAYREYKKVVEDLEANKEMLEEETDKEMKEMLSEEISSLKDQEEELEKKIQILLLPKDPNDDKNVFVEIRGGAGGDDGLYFYKKIVDDSDKILKENGVLAFEIGHDQGKEVSDLMIEKGYKNVRVVKDLAGHDRVVVGEL